MESAGALKCPAVGQWDFCFTNKLECWNCLTTTLEHPTNGQLERCIEPLAYRRQLRRPVVAGQPERQVQHQPIQEYPAARGQLRRPPQRPPESPMENAGALERPAVGQQDGQTKYRGQLGRPSVGQLESQA